MTRLAGAFVGAMLIVSCASDPNMGWPGLFATAALDPPLAARTSFVLMIAREVPSAGEACADLWSDGPSTLAEARCTGDFVAGGTYFLPVDVDIYPALSVRLYAITGDRVVIAGGCTRISIANGAEAAAVEVALAAPPGSVTLDPSSNAPASCDPPWER